MSDFTDEQKNQEIYEVTVLAIMTETTCLVW
jgi:hypothetical protein